MPVEEAAGDDAGQCDGVLEHGAERAGEFVAGDGLGREGLGGMEQNGKAELLSSREQPVEWSFVAPDAREVRVEQNAAEAGHLETSREFGARGPLILQRQRAQPTEAARVEGNERRQCVVNQCSDPTSVGAEPLGAWIVHAQEGVVDATRIHHRQLVGHARVVARHGTKPTAHL